MTFVGFTHVPPSVEDIHPWHPETLEDIREVDLMLLPHISNLELDNHRPLSGVLAGAEEEIKEKMEGAFLHFPGISFARGKGGVVMFEREDN